MKAKKKIALAILLLSSSILLTPNASFAATTTSTKTETSILVPTFTEKDISFSKLVTFTDGAYIMPVLIGNKPYNWAVSPDLSKQSLIDSATNEFYSIYPMKLTAGASPSTQNFKVVKIADSKTVEIAILSGTAWKDNISQLILDYQKKAGISTSNREVAFGAVSQNADGTYTVPVNINNKDYKWVVSSDMSKKTLYDALTGEEYETNLLPLADGASRSSQNIQVLKKNADGTKTEIAKVTGTSLQDKVSPLIFDYAEQKAIDASIIPPSTSSNPSTGTTEPAPSTPSTPAESSDSSSGSGSSTGEKIVQTIGAVQQLSCTLQKNCSSATSGGLMDYSPFRDKLTYPTDLTPKKIDWSSADVIMQNNKIYKFGVVTGKLSSPVMSATTANVNGVKYSPSTNDDTAITIPIAWEISGNTKQLVMMSGMTPIKISLINQGSNLLLAVPNINTNPNAKKTSATNALTFTGMAVVTKADLQLGLSLKNVEKITWEKEAIRYGSGDVNAKAVFVFKGKVISDNVTTKEKAEYEIAWVVDKTKAPATRTVALVSKDEKTQKDVFIPLVTQAFVDGTALFSSTSQTSKVMAVAVDTKDLNSCPMNEMWQVWKEKHFSAKTAKNPNKKVEV